MTSPQSTPVTSVPPVVENQPIVTQPVKTRRSPFLIPAIVILAVLALLGAGTGVAWAVFVKHSDQGAIRQIAKILPLPAAKIGSKTILYRDFLRSRDTLKIFLASSAAKEEKIELPLDQNMEKNVLEKLLMQAALEEAASQKKITVSDEELRQYFSEVIASTSSTVPDVGVYLLQNFGWNEEDFRQQVLRPALLEQRLAATMPAPDPATDQNPVATYLDARLQKKDVVRYLRF